MDTLSSIFILSPDDIDKTLVAKQDDGLLDANSLQQLSSRIQMSVLGNRFLYLWVYKLQQYRELQLTSLFNTVAYIRLAIWSVLTIFFLNIVVLKVDPTQFKFDTYPSLMAMLLYGMAGFALNDAGGLTPNGDWSYLLRVIAGFCGLFFVGVLLANLMMTFKGARSDTELKEAVTDLRPRARQQEAEFEAALRVGIDEACNRLLELGLASMAFLINYFKRAIPAEFLANQSDPTEHTGAPPAGIA